MDAGMYKIEFDTRRSLPGRELGQPNATGASVTTPRSATTIALPAILLVALLVRVGAAALMPNTSHTDEIYQYLEPAHHLVFGYGVVSWEFREGLRSWVLPGFIAGLMKMAATFSDDPRVYLGAVATGVSLLSLVVVAVAFAWGRRLYGTTGAVITATLAAAWPELIYFAPKALSDVVATHALVLAVFLVYPEPQTRRSAAFFACGFCLGLGFAVRYPMGPIFAVVALFACRGDIKGRWLPLVLGAAGPVIFAGLLDAVTWTYPFQSIWKNYWNDMVLGVTAEQGLEPWYWYIGVEVLNWSGALVPLLVLGWLGARRMPCVGFLVLFILVFFTLISHKTYRFIYPALPFFIILVGLGTSEVVARLGRAYPRWAEALVGLAVIGWPLTSAALFIDDHFQTYMHKDGAVLDAFVSVGRQPSLCGVGIVGIKSWRTPGYTYLHRNVPMYLLPADEIARRKASFNYLIASQDSPVGTADFTRMSCAANAGFSADTRSAICVYRRPGPCVASTERPLQDGM